MTRNLVLLSLLLAVVATAAQPGGQARCVGGTLAAFQTGLKGTVQTADQNAFVFVTNSSTLRIPYQKINSVEYGQEVSRRVVLAWVVSPLFLLMKARAHFVTLNFTDDNGRQQALVLRVDKHLIRPALATLEARTGRAVQYHDADARKFYHG